MGGRETIRKVFEESIAVKNEFLSDDEALTAVVEAGQALVDCYRRGGKVIVFGNGGSAADSQHLAAELVVRFEKERKSLPCIALTANSSILTAASNDYAFEKIFSRQVEAFASPGDIVVAISTSGSSANVLEAVRSAREKNIQVIALTGNDGGKLKEEADIAIVIKTDNTARIQEVHETVIHGICKIVESSTEQ